MGELPEKENNKLKKEVAHALSPKGWKERTAHVCKPCWELKYCPYGNLVEDFPIADVEVAKAEELGWYAKPAKNKGRIPCDKDEEGAIPDINRVILKFGRLDKHACEIFGHTCPVFFVNEPLTETSSFRKIKRNILNKTFLRVVRRDNQTCQICGTVLKDNEIRIDHIIPFSEGGPTEESNLRVLCDECNRKKGADVEI